jgi:hypothetical protein
MHSPEAAFFDFHQIVQALSGLSERQQITSLKFELFHALERARDFRAQGLELEQTIAELRGDRAACDREQSAMTARLRAECERTAHELEALKTDREKHVRILRLELVAAELLCEALEETCRALVRTLEHAARAAEDDGPALADAQGLSA